MVTNMIPAQALSRFFSNFIHKMALRCEDGTVTDDFLDELPNFHIGTFSKLFIAFWLQAFVIGDHFNCTIFLFRKWIKKRLIFHVGLTSVSIK